MLVENQPFRFWLILTHLAWMSTPRRRQQAAQNSEGSLSITGFGLKQSWGQILACRLLAM